MFNFGPGAPTPPALCTRAARLPHQPGRPPSALCHFFFFFFLTLALVLQHPALCTRAAWARVQAALPAWTLLSLGLYHLLTLALVLQPSSTLHQGCQAPHQPGRPPSALCHFNFTFSLGAPGTPRPPRGEGGCRRGPRPRPTKAWIKG